VNRPAGPAWPSRLLSVVHVRRWIATALRPSHGRVAVAGPVEVYSRKGNPWSVTARFAVRARTGPETAVVFKAVLLPRSFYLPRVERLLMRVCPEHVPELLVAEVLDEPTFPDPRPRARWAPEVVRTQRGRLYALYRPFAGVPVYQSERPEAVVELARTLARIQVAVAARPEAETDGIPRVPPAAVATQYEAWLRYVRDHHLPRWERGSGRSPRDLGDPRRVLERLERLQAKVRAWAEELRAGGWPLTIDHTDFHHGNAVVQADGRIVVFDWVEAVLSSPFFSLEELLWRPGVRAAEVRDAYLDALPWQTRARRERALELGARLSEVKNAYNYEVFWEAFGRPGGSAGSVDQFVRQTLPRWEAEG
jgi:hypothetical protein